MIVNLFIDALAGCVVGLSLGIAVVRLMGWAREYAELRYGRCGPFEAPQ